MGQHAIDSVEVLFALGVQLLGLRLKFLEATFRVNVDCIFSDLAQIELLLERLRRLACCQSLSQTGPATEMISDAAYSGNALLESFETHPTLRQ